MVREIVTRPITTEEIREELSHLVQHFRGLGHESCRAGFGGAWAIDYDGGATDGEGLMPLEAVAVEVGRASATGWGGLGSNDLFVSVPPLSLLFRFCNDSDLHLAFEAPCEPVEHFRRRWEMLGYEPVEHDSTDPRMRWGWEPRPD